MKKHSSKTKINNSKYETLWNDKSLNINNKISFFDLLDLNYVYTYQDHHHTTHSHSHTNVEILHLQMFI